MRHISQTIKKQNESLDDLIGISHQNVLKNIKEENREFLLLQRKKRDVFVEWEALM